MRIFVTGGTGFIGSHVLVAAIDAGHEVVALRRSGAEPRITLNQQPFWCEGSLSDNWSHELHSCDAVVHMAAYGVSAGANDWDRCFQANVIDSVRLWRQAIEAGVSRFVIIGSCFEYGRAGERYARIPVDAPLEPTTAYGASKAAGTMAALALAIEHKLSLVILRPFHVYGPGEDPRRFWPSLVRAAKTGADLTMTAGEQIRDFQPVQETCAQILLGLNIPISPGIPQIYNLGTGSPISLLDFAQREWVRLDATGTLLPGARPYRANEVMRYVPFVRHFTDPGLSRQAS